MKRKLLLLIGLVVIMAGCAAPLAPEEAIDPAELTAALEAVVEATAGGGQSETPAVSPEAPAIAETETAEPAPTEGADAPAATPSPAQTANSAAGIVSQPAGENQVIDIDSLAEPMATFVGDIVADLGQRLAIEATSIQVAKIQSVTWRDGSLGCGQPGRMYTMALVPGYQVVLAVDGELYNYHTADTSHFVFCNQGPSKGLPAVNE